MILLNIVSDQCMLRGYAGLQDEVCRRVRYKSIPVPILVEVGHIPSWRGWCNTEVEDCCWALLKRLFKQRKSCPGLLHLTQVPCNMICTVHLVCLEPPHYSRIRDFDIESSLSAHGQARKACSWVDHRCTNNFRSLPVSSLTTAAMGRSCARW